MTKNLTAILCFAAFALVTGCGKPEPTVTEQVVDKTPAYTMDGVYPIWISPDFQRIAVALSASDKAPISINGQVVKGGYLVTDSVQWQPGGNRCFYSLRLKNGEEHVYLDQQDLGAFQDHRLTFTDDGRRWALWEGTPKPAQRILIDGEEKKMPSVRDLRFAGPDHRPYFKNDLAWTDEKGVDVQSTLAAELEVPRKRQKVVTPRGTHREASATTKPAELTLQLKLHRQRNANLHQLWVNGKQVGEYDQVLERRIPAENRSEWHHVAADGTITLYAVKDSRVVRITVRPAVDS